MLQDKPKDVTGFLNTFFHTLQLLTLQFPREYSDIPWQLQIARLAVPIVAVLASFHIIIGFITRPARIALLPYTRNHIVICRSETLTEGALAALIKRGRRVVTAAATIDSTQLDKWEGLGLTIMESDPLHAETFTSLNLKHAAALFLTFDDDIVNLDRSEERRVGKECRL